MQRMRRLRREGIREEIQGGGTSKRTGGGSPKMLSVKLLCTDIVFYHVCATCTRAHACVCPLWEYACQGMYVESNPGGQTPPPTLRQDLLFTTGHQASWPWSSWGLSHLHLPSHQDYRQRSTFPSGFHGLQGSQLGSTSFHSKHFANETFS